MNIEKNKAVSVSYELRIAENEKKILVEKTETAHPLVFLFGSGGMLEAFENNLKGLKVGDNFDFVIDYRNGYGERHPDNITQIPIEVFKDEKGTLNLEKLKIGTVLPMVDDRGHRLHGLIKAVSSDTVTMDFNHTLAEKDLHFTGKVLQIRNATSDEIAHGHIHGAGGHHH